MDPGPGRPGGNGHLCSIGDKITAFVTTRVLDLCLLDLCLLDLCLDAFLCICRESVKNYYYAAC